MMPLFFPPSSVSEPKREIKGYHELYTYRGTKFPQETRRELDEVSLDIALGRHAERVQLEEERVEGVVMVAGGGCGGCRGG